MNFKEYWQSLDEAGKKSLAEDCGTSKEYLRHCSKGYDAGYRNPGMKTIKNLLRARKEITLDMFFD
tara:strand:+ start:21 stop:218 length:198 start_codon:yes stop_codon:yes gene_type:complete